MSDLKNNQCHIQLFEVKLTRLVLWVAIVYRYLGEIQQEGM